MVFLAVFKTAAPVFLIIAAGYLLGFFKKIDLEATSDLVLYLTSPCLAFTAIYKGHFNLRDFLQLWGSFIFVAGLLGLMVFLITQTRRGATLSWFYLPVIFMNSGNLGFPLSLVFFGENGLTLAVILNTINAICIYSVGLAIVRQSRALGEFLKLPYLYALLAGIFFLWAKIRIPVVIISPLKMIGDLTIPLLLLGLGQRLHDFKMKYLLISLGPVVLRLLGGFIAAIVFVLLFKVSGLTRNIIILIASLPAAITGYMLAEKYNFYPEEVATSVTVSNFVGIFWVPVVIWLLTISGL